MKRFYELGCTGCHRPPAFTGPPLPGGFFVTFPFHDSPYVSKYKLRDDTGREAVTRNSADKHKYRVPTLRNVSLTAPYFHNGSVSSLNEAVRVMAASQIGATLSDEDAADIVNFLDALTGPFPAMTLPRLPETPGTSIVPANGSPSVN
jgi:cytochrome c peroxidase